MRTPANPHWTSVVGCGPPFPRHDTRLIHAVPVESASFKLLVQEDWRQNDAEKSQEGLCPATDLKRRLKDEGITHVPTLSISCKSLGVNELQHRTTDTVMRMFFLFIIR